MKNFIKNKNGFTLTELFIVIIIMGIVLAVAIPSYNALVKKAYVQTCGDVQMVILNNFNEKYQYKTKNITAPKFDREKNTFVKKVNPETKKSEDVLQEYNVSVVKPGTITIQTGPSGDYLDCYMGTTGIIKDDFIALFSNKIVPCCNVPNNCIKINITWSWVYASSYDISITCCDIDGNTTAHKINTEDLIAYTKMSKENK